MKRSCAAALALLSSFALTSCHLEQVTKTTRPSPPTGLEASAFVALAWLLVVGVATAVWLVASRGQGGTAPVMGRVAKAVLAAAGLSVALFAVLAVVVYSLATGPRRTAPSLLQVAVTDPPTLNRASIVPYLLGLAVLSGGLLWGSLAVRDWDGLAGLWAVGRGWRAVVEVVSRVVAVPVLVLVGWSALLALLLWPLTGNGLFNPLPVFAGFPGSGFVYTEVTSVLAVAVVAVALVVVTRGSAVTER